MRIPTGPLILRNKAQTRLVFSWSLLMVWWTNSDPSLDVSQILLENSEDYVWPSNHVVYSSVLVSRNLALMRVPMFVF